MSYKFNPFTGTLDDVGPNNGNGVPGGSDTQVQFNDGGVFGGDVDFTYNKTSNLLTLGGDINLNDGGSFTTTIQCVTPTQNRTISFPNATGTVGLVAGSSGNLVVNQSGAYAGVANSSVDNATGNITLGSRLISTVNGAADAPPVRISGTWFAGTSANSLPALYVSPTGTSAGTSWSASGTGIGVNAPAAFGGNLLDLQVNGTSIASITSGGLLTCGSAGVTFGTNNVRTTPGYNNLVIRGGNVDSIVTGNDGSGGSRTIIGGYLGFTDQALTTASLAGDLRVTRDAANTLAQRNGTAAQTFRVYNTFTDASNYERGFLRWSSNVFEVGPEAAGTGTARPMRITAATLKLPNLPTYADNAAATTGGLVAGDVYKTATGELRITV